jgi:hypothetical protein
MESVVEPHPASPALLAFYLPQFHPIPENDEWWGAGFTEWRNVVRGPSLYPNHHQPNIPGELGFYDLRLPEVREAQAALADAHGITGFCYYHYWFSGRRILEMPFNEVMRTGRPDFPFCLCWANEPWTRNWDGGSREVLIAQRYSAKDDRNHIRWLTRAFRDERYIRVGDRPVLFVYNIGALPAPRRTAEIWREECIKAGVGDPYLVQFATFGNTASPADTGFDAAAEFLPHHVYDNLLALGRKPIVDSRGMRNLIYEYDDLVDGQLALELPWWPRYQCVVPNWDNTARKPQGSANLFLGSTPEKYERWLSGTIEKARAAQHEFVLINAWNEWAEGAYLEPDLRHGRAYLEATARAAGVDPARVDLRAIERRGLTADDGTAADDVLRELYEDLKASSARETAELMQQIQALEDALAAAGAGSYGHDAELAQRVADLERRLAVRVTNRLGRSRVTGRAVRTLGVLRRDWTDL